MTGGPSQFARVLTHVDTSMAANDLAPEIIPAETLQQDDSPAITPRFGFGLLALSLASIGAHLIWLAFRT